MPRPSPRPNKPSRQEQLATLRAKLNDPSISEASRVALEKAIVKITYRKRGAGE